MERDEVVLLDIIRAARLVIEFKEGLDKSEFFEDYKTQSAVLHQLIVIGEAVKRLSINFRSRYSQIPWSLIAGMRDKLIHGYDIVDLKEVWRTAEVDIPALLASVEGLLSKNGQIDKL